MEVDSRHERINRKFEKLQSKDGLDAYYIKKGKELLSDSQMLLNLSTKHLCAVRSMAHKCLLD